MSKVGVDIDYCNGFESDVDYNNIDYSELDQKALKRSRYILEGVVANKLPESSMDDFRHWFAADRNRKEKDVALWELFDRMIEDDDSDLLGDD